MYCGLAWVQISLAHHVLHGAVGTQARPQCILVIGLRKGLLLQIPRPTAYPC